MKTEKSYSNWTQGTCVPADVLWDYVENKLSSDQQHRVERHVLDCPLCADALEGFQHSGKRARMTQLHAEMEKQITYRSDWYLGAAAASVVTVAATGLLWWVLGTKPVQDNIAQAPTPAKKETTISAKTPVQKGNDTPAPMLNSPGVYSDGFLSTAPQGLNTTVPSANGTVAPVSPSASYQWSTNTGTYQVEPDIPATADEVSKEERSAVAHKDTVMVNVAEAEDSYWYNKSDVAGSAEGAGPGAPAPRARETGDANRKPVKSKQAPAAPAAPAEKKASLAEGMYYYNTSNYTEAIKIFKKVLSDDASNQEARYYLGMSYKGSGDKTRALEELTKVTSSCIYYDDAVWNRSLLLIETGRKEEARPLLQQLVNGGGKYAQMAMNKLNEL